MMPSARVGGGNRLNELLLLLSSLTLRLPLIRYRQTGEDSRRKNMIKRVTILVGLLCSLGWSTGLLLLAQDHSDEVAIRKIVEEEVTAWNKGDAVAYSRHFAEDGTFTNILGEFYKGHDAFENEHAHILNTIFRGSTLQQDIVSLQFANPDVAVVEVLTAVSGAKLPPARKDTLDAKGRLRTRLLQVMVRSGGAWKIVAYHNVEVKNAVSLPEPK